MNQETFQLHPLYFSLNYWGGKVFSELKSEIVSEFHRTARYYPSSSVHVCGGVSAQESGNTPSIPCFIHRVRPTSYNPVRWIQNPADKAANHHSVRAAGMNCGEKTRVAKPHHSFHYILSPSMSHSLVPAQISNKIMAKFVSFPIILTILF